MNGFAQTPSNASSMLTPRKIAAQLVGFLIGAALLGWCIKVAVAQGDWSRIASADPWLIAGLIGCTIVSLGVNGIIFWLVIRPIQPLRLTDMLLLNLTVSILNYAPIRLGLISRVAYHIRVDRMPLLRMGAWFASLAYTMLLALGSCVMATIIHDEFDLVWAAIVAGQLLLGGLLTRAIMNQSLVARYGRGMNEMLSAPASLWGALLLRLFDIGAFVGRMACAVAILQPEAMLAASDVLLLGFAALALSLNPLGRFGFREAAVTLVAARLVSAPLSGPDIDGQLAQIALIESAGEAMAAIPLGVIGLIWFRGKWKRSGDRESGIRDQGPGPESPTPAP